MQYDMVPDRHVVSDDQGMSIVGHMQHAEVLDVGPIADSNKVHIAPDHGMEPDTAGLAHHHVPDHDAGVFDETGAGNGWLDALVGTDHAPHSRRSATGIASVRSLTGFSSLP